MASSLMKEKTIPLAVHCRCGGKPSKPEAVVGCKNRWSIHCMVERCYARNTGQGLADVITGWNRLSTHFYR